ncbi:PREDICTED: gelsolin, cytoplasmic [Nicrophorus vespilloides]|uniref:Gelsolin, cytoplasmic n=1 Tax=Nicrophorus vespilloides TaxID=110193 RepID=A0ABM1NF95_NICVS|nr:PREDICTED: gelsolin, cytoplasmic [Nicrophorus vespilloides]XP_017785496.1 PREDICTED: gelsolin, cytoplasmic [Nicrophorus vespilloides]XP_017785497.1 PREDICTED: gelsolin, cytoplasmic [Nicrophorus vespilloides]
MLSNRDSWIYRSKWRLYLSLLFAVLCSTLSEFEAATAGRRTTQPIIPKSPATKDKRVMEPAFANAGQVPGLEIWRIENFKPVAYPKDQYGKFYTGDSYVILFTKDSNGIKSWDIHFWLGKETSQDESGTAAIMTVHLDDQLGGGPVQYREVQEHESQTFLSHFKNGVRYLPGGIATGFSHVDRNKHDKKLYHIKGKRNIRVKEVKLSIASMNKGDCFILDVGSDVYVYVGPKSKRAERLKAISAANQVRDQDHGGRSKIHIIDEYSTSSEYDEYFSKLGEGSQSEVPDESAGGDDEQFEKQQEHVVTLYKVSDASGTLETTEIGQKPLLQSMLDTNDCFILTTESANIYVWVGKKCNSRERSQSMNTAQTFMKTKNYPDWTQIQRIVENAEPSTFQQYFKTWKTSSELHTRLIRSTDVTDKAKIEQKSGGAAPDFMPDDGSGELEIFRIEDFELAPVDKETYGKFFGGDSYVIKYTYNSNNYIIYMWQGNESTNDEKAASAFQAVKLDNELHGKAVQIRVVQGHEPKHFLHIFKGKLVTFLGGKASGFKNLNDHDTYVEGETRMFRIRGTNEDDVRGSQQVASAKSLASDDVFIVDNDSNTWIWMGKDSNEHEKSLAENFATFLVPNSSPEVINEGDEPDTFWDALNGKDSYAESFESEQQPALQPNLYHCILTPSNNIKIETIKDYEQDDLVEDDVMILDAGNEVYVWIGSGADEDEKKHSVILAQNYLRGHGRSHVIVLVVKQGSEPSVFTSLFPSWDEGMWDNQVSYESIKSKFEN